ncbi:chorismate mutase [Thermomonospora curvata]|uniref:Chorismate mutase n=1 Tax=Thermomonospora curvata (strain ATCC 19995 / DSM 43183 / JCM 3096 / KCTC 9072 / NBRC 15933 / NCIMB 10081 / Henssen B9) TaxID=471852 RepID=D1A7S9_THECD|nr:chorismate mutase [Thermomonospora curvata]ACY98451.1 Chorismate mutase [Thermomonospora curvata DSM 43183]
MDTAESVIGEAEVTCGLPTAAQVTSLEEARAAIDRVDAALAVLLERRAELAGAVQRLKPVGGFAGRDRRREHQIVEAMARRAPSLGAERLARIMNAVIEAGLEVAEESREAR